MIKNPSGQDPVRTAIIGCGAVARRCHIPALPLAPRLSLRALVDLKPAHAREALDIWTQNGGRSEVAVAASFQDVLDEFDAAVVCTAHTTHEEVAVALLDAGKHVLVEKPLGVSPESAERIVARARKRGRVASVGHVRRLFPATGWVKSLLRDGALGTVEHVDWAEGQPYDWELTTPSMFARDLAGGGVVIDVGSHVFDVLATWFGENCEVLDYQDDNQGGVETEGRARLRFGDVNVTVALSRLRKLANTCVIRGSERTLKVGTGFTTTFEITDREGAVVRSGQVPVLPPAAGEWTELFAGQLRMFADAVATGAPSLADATAGVATARVTAACYGHPGRPKGVPSWAAFDLPDGAASLEGLRVGVTGATGFIGGRLVDALVTASRAQVVAAVRDFRRLVRLSPLDQDRLTFARLDLDDPRALLDSPVDVFVHCAHGNRGTVEERWRTSVEGTRNALRMAEAAGARRFVHISTVSVYDTSTVESLTESGSAFEPDADDREYAAQKLAAERIALTEARGMDVVVLQPTVVYGPQSGGWTVRPLTRMPADSAILPTGDAGVCNAVYVDDVVSAIILAIATPEAAGRRFLISGDRPISWGRFYDAYRDMCDGALAEADDKQPPTERSRNGSADSTRAPARCGSNSRGRCSATAPGTPSTGASRSPVTGPAGPVWPVERTTSPPRILREPIDAREPRAGRSTRSMRVVAIAPHPDDELIGAGGSLIKHARRGDEVTTIHVVERDRSMLDAGTSAADFAREIVNANAELGVRECVSLDAASRDLTLSRELRLAVVKVLRRVRPAIVYLPHEAEADQEHQLVHHLAMDAIWMAGSQFFGEAGPTPSPPPRLVLGYEVWTPLARFQLTEDIGDVIDAKVRAMRSYTSQLRHADWEAAIRGMAAYRGTVTMGGGFAEVFEVLRVGGGVSAIGDAVRERPAAASVPAPVPDPVTKGAGR